MIDPTAMCLRDAKIELVEDAGPQVRERSRSYVTEAEDPRTLSGEGLQHL